MAQLFSKIQDFVDDSGALVFVLVDEVESLTSARKAAVAGNEPSDAIRSVNALLTHLDALRAHPNVFVLCTSNLPDAVDIAFVDRADIKVWCCAIPAGLFCKIVVATADTRLGSFPTTPSPPRAVMHTPGEGGVRGEPRL